MKKIKVVAAIIINDSEILCMQRNQAKYSYISYKYEFPGGKIEEGETPVQALHRELTEELAIDVCVKSEDFFMEVHHTYPDFHIDMKVFICEVANREFVRKEHIAHQWLPKKNLWEVDWAEADKPIVEKLVKG